MRRNNEQGAEKDDEGDCSPGAITGGYYWLPTPGHATLCWDVVTCHQLEFEAKVGHVEMWTAVLDRLAVAWGKDAAVLRRLLKDCCCGLVGRRVTTSGQTHPDFLIQRPQRCPAFGGVLAEFVEDLPGDPCHGRVLDRCGGVVVGLAVSTLDPPRCPIWDTCHHLLAGAADGALADLQQVGDITGRLGGGFLEYHLQEPLPLSPRRSERDRR